MKFQLYGILVVFLCSRGVFTEFLSDDEITVGHIDSFLEVLSLKSWLYEDAGVLEVAIQYKSPAENQVHWFAEVGHRSVPTESPYIVPILDKTSVRSYSEYDEEKKEGKATVKLGPTAITKYKDFILTAVMTITDHSVFQTSSYHQSFDRITTIIDSLKSNGFSQSRQGTLHIVRNPPAEVAFGDSKINQLVVNVQDFGSSQITPDAIKKSLLIATQLSPRGDGKIVCERQALSDGFMSINVNSSQVLKTVLLEARDLQGTARFRTSITKLLGFVETMEQLELKEGKEVLAIPRYLFQPVSAAGVNSTEVSSSNGHFEISTSTPTSLACVFTLPAIYRLLQSRPQFQLLLGGKPLGVHTPLVFRMMSPKGPNFVALFTIDSPAMDLVNEGLYSCSVKYGRNLRQQLTEGLGRQITVVNPPVVSAIVNRQDQGTGSRQVNMQCSARSDRPIQLNFFLVSSAGQEVLLKPELDSRVREIYMNAVQRGLDSDLVLVLSREQDLTSNIQCRVSDQAGSVVVRSFPVSH